jgi:flagellar biosynthesis GTPase FlhF
MPDISKVDFNYASVDEETAAKLEYFAKTGKALIRKSQIQFLADMGKLLSEAQAVLSEHKVGTFIKWATAEFDIDKSTVYRYVNAWERILSQACDNYLHWSQGALYLASAEDFPKPVLKKLEKIPATDLVRTSDVKRLVEASKPKPDPDDDPPFDDVSEMTPAEAAKAAKAREKADAAAAKEKAKADAKAEREAAKAAKEAEKAAAAAEKEKAKADKEAAKAAALTTDGQAKHLKSMIQQHIDKAVRAVDDLHHVNPNAAKRTAAVKLLQGVELW